MTAPLVIYCDASAPHALTTKEDARSGWGAVFVREGKVIAEAKGPMNRMESTVAELKAVRNSLEHALAQRLARPGSSVIVASDCSAVECYLAENNAVAKRKELAALAEGIRRVATKADVVLIATWVKGHRAAAPTHGAHNARADRLSKQAAGVLPSDAEMERKRLDANEKNRAKMREVSRAVAEARAARKAENLAEQARLRADRLQRACARAAQLEGRT